MATSAYLLIKAAKAIRQNGYLEALEDLWALPEVEYVEPVSGLYDCVARVEAPITLIFLVHKVMAKSWIERVHVLSVDEPAKRALESEEARAARLRRQREIIGAYRRGLPRPPLPAQEPYSGHADAIAAESEQARTARLMRQRALIKARWAARERPPRPAQERYPCHDGSPPWR